MGRELQKKKNRSSIAKVRQKPKSKKLNNPQGNAVVAANWDKTQTLRQNYSRLGLTVRLNASTGGTEKSTGAIHEDALRKEETRDPLAVVPQIPRALLPTEARVERDADGAIIRVIHPQRSSLTTAKRRAADALNDPLVALDSDSEQSDNDDTGRSMVRATKLKTAVVTELEAQAANAAPKRVRAPSARETEWIRGLVEKYGDDYTAMRRDRRLNPMQQSEGDLRKRIKRWKESGGRL